jgi:hypothetical protein
MRLLCPAWIELPDCFHEVVVTNATDTTRDRTHDGPPVTLLKGKCRNPQARQGSAHDVLVVRSFDLGELPIHQSIPNPRNGICVPYSNIFKHLGAFKSGPSVFIVKQIVPRKNIEHEIRWPVEAIVVGPWIALFEFAMIYHDDDAGPPTGPVIELERGMNAAIQPGAKTAGNS